MVFLYILLFLMGVVSEIFILEHRLFIGPMPVSLVDVALVLAFFSVTIFKGKTSPLDPTTRNYMWPILGLWGVALAASGLLGLVKGADTYLILQPIKWYLKMPVGMICGYYAVREVKNARRLIKFMCLLSCILCVMVLLNFGSRGSDYDVTGSFRALQSKDYYPRLAATISIFLVYTAAVNPRLMSRFLAAVVLTMSVIAVGAQLWRTAMVALTLSIILSVIIIPKEYRGRAWRALFTSGKWIVLATILGAVLSKTILSIDVVDIIIDRFRSIGEGESSALSRWEGAFSELKVWLSSTVIFGAGYGAVREIWEKEATTGVMGHNAITTTLARSGVVGLVALLYPFFVAYRVGRKMLQRMDPDIRTVGALMLAVTLYVGIENPLSGYLEGNAVFFGIICGMGLKCYRFLPSPEESALIEDQLNWQY